MTLLKPFGILWIGGLALCACLPAFSSEEISATQEEVSHRMEINRSLMMKVQAEYQSLLAQIAKNPASEILSRKVTGAEYKLKALKEDNQKLASLLPREEKAYEFIKDLIHDQQTSAIAVSAPEASDVSIPQENPSVPPPPKPLAELHERALKLVSEKNLVEAVKIYEEILLQNPDDDEAYVIMGHSYLLMGAYQKAERAFANAVHIDPNNIAEITPFYENMVFENPNDDGAFSNLGFAWLIVGNFEKSKEAFQEALRINPDNLAARQGLTFSSQRGL